MNEHKMYMVMALRWGSPSSDSYPVWVGKDVEIAKSEAEQIYEDRGGKYAGVIYEGEIVLGGWKGFKEIFRRKSMMGI